MFCLCAWEGPMHLELPLEGQPVFLMVEPSLQSTQLFNKKGKNPPIQNIPKSSQL